MTNSNSSDNRQSSACLKADGRTCAPAKWILTLQLLLSLAVSSLGQTAKFVQYAELIDKITPYRESLVSASVLYDKDRWYAQAYMVPTTPGDVQKFLADLSAIEVLMTGPYKDVAAPTPYRNNNILEFPGEWLTIAKARNEIIAKIQGASAAGNAIAEVKFLKDIIAKVKANNGWGLTENGLKIVLGKREEVRAKLCGGQKYEGWDAACDELIKTARAMAPTNRSYANYSDSSISTLIKNGWAKNYKDRTILKIATAKSEWTVVKDSLGRPKYRSKGVAVRYKVPGFDLVIEQTVSILEDYVGNGSYKYRPTSQLPDYRIVK